MEERQVTAGESTYKLPSPFFVLATQNPIEHEGTYALPEAELDRFLIKVLVHYPEAGIETALLDDSAGDSGQLSPLRPVLGPDALAEMRQAAEHVHIDEQVKRYIVSIVRATRPEAVQSGAKTASGSRSAGPLYRYIRFGASPRASIALCRCAKIRAALDGRDFATPEDVKAEAPAVLRHRLTLSYEAEADAVESDAVIERILHLVPVP
jgi:MoxR-like ATPase